MVEKEAVLNKILDKLPFSGKPDQLERLTDFFVANSEGNQKYVYDQTGISQPTIRRIKSGFKKLSKQEKAVLIDHISSALHGRALSDSD